VSILEGMRFAFLLPVPLASAFLACGAGATLGQSNGTKMGEALAFAGAAAVAQVVESAAEARARNNTAVTRSSTGATLTPQCDNSGQYPCVTVTPPQEGAEPAPLPPDPDMGEDEARDYVLGYVNGVRKLNAVGPVERDEAVDAFAQAGSEELGDDHRQNRHMAEHVRELGTASAEVQGPPDGAPAGSLQDRIAEILLRWMAEGPGGMHHDVLLRPGWRKVGVGIASRAGRIYFTVDFTGP
jgi:uncharacterized protein YkwD